MRFENSHLWGTKQGTTFFSIWLEGSFQRALILSALVAFSGTHRGTDVPEVRLLGLPMNRIVFTHATEKRWPLSALRLLICFYHILG